MTKRKAGRKARPVKKKTKHLSEKHRKAISKGLKQFWKRQSPEAKRPRGFRSSERDIEPMLNRAGRIMSKEHGVDSDVRRAVNADMSVDWELRFAIPKGVDLDDFTTDLANALRPAAHSWIATGVRFEAGKMTREEWEKYERRRDMLQVHAHYQAMTKGKIATNVLGLQTIMETMRTRRRRKPREVFVRVHWNMEGRKPK